METMRKVEVLNQKCGICFENLIVCAFLQCGLQYICESCCQNKGDVDKLKGILFRR